MLKERTRAELKRIAFWAPVLLGGLALAIGPLYLAFAMVGSAYGAGPVLAVTTILGCAAAGVSVWQMLEKVDPVYYKK